ncbi:MFS transporter [Vibrio mexicanus]|uniref:MFS transporter n=1 Tax=Vibrio mexicanus TaxID=1004326 RepID=UPI00069AFE05|nr:MFS transporter [Vibrio mexicanus]
MVNALDNKKGFILWILCLAQFTLSADIANLSISTSTLVSTFDTNISSIQLLGSIQPLIGAALMLSASMIGLIIGWRRLLIIGTAIGLISTVGFLFSNDVRLLILVVRPLTGVGSALILPAVLALVVAHFPGKQRALGFGLMAAATGLAAAIVPLFSGWVHDNFNWYWPFIFVASLYLVTLIGAIYGISPIHTNQPEKLDILAW